MAQECRDAKNGVRRCLCAAGGVFRLGHGHRGQVRLAMGLARIAPALRGWVRTRLKAHGERGRSDDRALHRRGNDLSSAANTVTPPAAAGQGKPFESQGKPESTKTGAARPDPVPLEVAVSVTGARANSGGARDLFTELTQTVLVFRDGAVIRLVAEVASGQLLFLTNKKSNEEVVCQVLHTRSFGTGSAYVELKFTESKENFWGVTFGAAAIGGTPELSAKEHVEAKETTQKDPAKVVQPHKEEEVEQLRAEVEALRKQLAGLKSASEPNAAPAKPSWLAKKHAAPVTTEAAESSEAAKSADAQELLPVNAPAPVLETPVPQVPPPTPEISAPIASFAAKVVEGLMAANEPAPVAQPASQATEKTAPFEAKRATTATLPENVSANASQAIETPLMPAATATEKQAMARAVVGMALPTGTKAGPANKDAAEELLPKPALDFSQMPAGTPAETKKSPRPQRAVDLRKVSVPILGLLLVVLAASLWFTRPWTFFGIGNRTTPATRVTKKIVAAAKAASAAVNASMTKDAAKDANDQKSDADTDADGNGDEREARARNADSANAKKRAEKTRSDSAETRDSASTASAPEPVVDAPVLPAKLLKAANPVYPPDAMRSFITGDVKAEATVQPNGRLAEIKVLSGPKPLRDAAVEALKQYQYEPATQGGKPLASKVEVVVKFWFNP
jgi:TonB family protein